MKIFGIKYIVINNTVIHTYNVMVSNNNDNLNIIKKSGLNYSTNAGRNSNRIQLTHTCTNLKDFDKKVSILGKTLKEIAKINLDKKYNWTNYMEDLKNECELNSLENQSLEC